MIEPPPRTRRDDVVELLHDTLVADPYRWLEDGHSFEVKDWVAAQQARTERVLGDRADRPALGARLSHLLRAGSSVGCVVAGERVFSLERWGHHDQSVLVVRSATSPGAARTLVDPHGATRDPTAAIDWYEPSPDGHLVAYGVSRGGDERSTLHLVDVGRGEPLDEHIPHTRACSVAWLPDASGFAYTRYPDPATVGEEDRGYWRTVYWHTVGRSPAADRQIWAELPDKAAWPNVSLSRDGRWLLVHIAIGWSRVDVHLIDRTTGARTVLIEGHEAVSQLTVDGDRLVGWTTLDAGRGRVIEAPLTTPWTDHWRTIVPESERVIEAVAVTRRSLLVLTGHHAVAHLDRHELDGSDPTPIPLPEFGSVAGFSASRDRDEAFFFFTSFTRPPTMYRWTRERVSDWSRLDEHDLDGEGPQGRYRVEQVWYPSDDGTNVSMFLIRAEETSPGPDTPCLLTGYGGFAISMSPSYSAAIVAHCDGGGVYAVANIRGGAEQGEAWHRAGMREHKQRSIDDFIAAADWLVEQGITSRQHLALRGGSNGGLLVGAAITQRPDLCRAAQLAVPLLDMVRYHRFLVARLWIPEYGDPDVAEEFAWLAAYSPYHHVAPDTCYPAVLITSGEGDSRVDPMHARKMAAALQWSSSCQDERPVLLRVEARAGHGQGKPVSKQVAELADVLAFCRWQLGPASPGPDAV
ncbi:MAG: prolyl oligopeptidase family serine peptidase [Acidimicrobiales bacterium]